MTVITEVTKTGKLSFIAKCIECKRMYSKANIYDAKKSRIGNLCTPCTRLLIDMKEITQANLNKAFTYCPLTGELRHAVNTLRGTKGELATTKHSQGYLSVSIGGAQYLAHRLIYLLVTGVMPNEIDHINHTRDCNIWSNLREVTRTENNKNTSISSNNTTGVTGVSFHKPTRKFRAYMTINYKPIHIGLFDTLDDAQAARKEYETTHNFHPNHGK